MADEKQDSVEVDNKRVYWHSRRGMLEIDLALMPFAEEVYPGLSDEDKTLYKLFLEEEDADIFAWLMGHKEMEDEKLKPMLEQILAHKMKAPE